MHDRLLCNANRVKRRLSDDPSCLRCEGQEETLTHLFRYCPASKNIWRCVGGAALYNSFFTGTLQQWITRNLKLADGLIFADMWPTSFSVTLWWIWRWRNCVMFDRNDEIPTDVGGFLHTRITETWNVFRDQWDIESCSSTTGRKKEVFVRWISPPYWLDDS